MHAIEVVRLVKQYGRRTVVDDVSFTVAPGQVCGFLGPNGSGKSTTIGMLLGTIRPTGGRVRLFGAEAGDALAFARRRIGATFEQPGCYPYLSADENLRIAAMVKRVPPTRITAVLERVGLAGHAREQVRTFSLGMRQRLALASALLGAPDLLVLDEPTNGLDPEGVHDLRLLLRALAADGAAVFLSSHLLHEVQALCTHAIVILAGKVVRTGDLRTLAGSETVVTLEAPDPGRLRDIVGQHVGATLVAAEGAAVVVRLVDGDVAALSRFLVERGIAVTHLAQRQRTIEDVFLEATRSSTTRAPAPA